MILQQRSIYQSRGSGFLSLEADSPISFKAWLWQLEPH